MFKKFKTSLVAFMVATVGIVGIAAVTVPQAQAANCTGTYGVCLYANAGFSGAILAMGDYSYPTSGYYPNLKSQGFNDVASSVKNKADYTQKFWQNSERGGWLFTVGPNESFTYVNDYYNDKISSAQWDC